MLESSSAIAIFQRGNQRYLAKQCIADIAALQQKIPSGYQRWALCFKDHYTFFVALLAVLSKKLEPVLLPNNQPGSLRSLKSEYDAMLTDISFVSDQSEKKCIFLECIENDNINNLVLNAKDLSSKQRIIFFTSGSTGQPKKVFRTLEELSSEINQLEASFGSRMDGSVFTTVSHQHIYGLLFYILWPLCSGRLINLMQLNYPEQIIRVFNNSTPLILITSPALLKRMPESSVSENKITIFSSGGLLRQTVSKSIYESVGIYPIEVFGSSETSAVAYRVQENTTRWQPFPSVELKLNSKTGCLMVIQSPFFDCKDAVMMGDMAYFNKDGSFELLGRADRIVKIEEKRVSLTEIENLLESDELVEQSYVLRLEENRQYIAAVITLTSKGRVLLESMGKSYLNNRLKKLLSEHIEVLLLPKKFRYVDMIPTNSQGKHIPAMLEKLFES
ncbi:MAG: acyl-CoA synthetase [uncultured bacterium]|nr:MAG: acyl-CoA synthetase [uncultured bacterium]